MADLKTMKGKVLKPNTELWDTEGGNFRVYNSAQGVVDIVITNNVTSWIKQGLIEVYPDGQPDGAEVKAAELQDVIAVAKKNNEAMDEEELDKEISAVKKKHSKKRR